MSDSRLKTWSCKIGEIEEEELDRAIADRGKGNDFMRSAVEGAYVALTGGPPKFTFSGWGGQLDEGERSVVEDREPDLLKTGWLEHQLHELRMHLREEGPLPEWGELEWLAMLQVKLGQLAFTWHPEERQPDYENELGLLNSMAAICLDAMECLRARWTLQTAEVN